MAIVGKPTPTDNTVKCGSGLARDGALNHARNPKPYGNRMVDPVVRRPDNSVCAFAASFSEKR